MAIVNKLTGLHHSVFAVIEKQADSWLLGFFARFTFAAVIFYYYFHSASIKIGDGLFGFLDVQLGAYIQILTEARLVEHDFELANVPLIEKIIVHLGTYAEFVLPVLIVLGLFTRLAALGMIGFILVQSYVDITGHISDAEQRAETLGAWFDRFSDSLILDQRALWVFLLLVLVLKGAGAISLDKLLAGRAANA